VGASAERYLLLIPAISKQHVIWPTELEEQHNMAKAREILARHFNSVTHKDNPIHTVTSHIYKPAYGHLKNSPFG